MKGKEKDEKNNERRRIMKDQKKKCFVQITLLKVFVFFFFCQTDISLKLKGSTFTKERYDKATKS